MDAALKKSGLTLVVIGTSVCLGCSASDKSAS